MALTVQGSGSSATTTVTIPAHAVGDLIVIMARGTVAPTIPAAGGNVPTWVEVGTGGVNNSVGLRVARAVATSTTHTSGTWTSAAQMHALVIRKSGSGAIGIGAAPAQAGANNTQTIVYPALTFTAGMADNLAVRFGARGVADTEVRTSGGFATGGTFRTEQPATTPTSAVFTKPITANESSFSATTAGTNAAYRALVFEVTEQPPRPAVPTGAYGSVVHATSGLLHYWRLDEPSGTLVMDCKSTLDGATSGGATRNVTGLIPTEASGKCTQFDGTDDYVQVPDAASLDLTSAISVEFWVDTTGTAFPADKTLVQKGGSWSFWSAGGAVRFEVDGVDSAEDPSIPTPGGKYHIVGTYDGTTVRLYMNGSQVGAATLAGSIIAGTGNLRIGADTGGAPLYLASKFSDVAIYNVALSAPTVAAHYSAGTAAGDSETATPADTLTVGDTVSFVKGYGRSQPDTLTVVDVPLTVAAFNRDTLADSLTVVDVPLTVAAFNRDTLADALTIADGQATATGKTATVPDTLTVVDVPLTVAAFNRDTLADALSVSDVPQTVAVFNRDTLADALTVSDVPVVVAAFNRDTLADVLTIVDFPVTVAAFNRDTLADVLTIADSRALGPGLAVAEALGIADAQSLLAATSRTVADTLTIVDNVLAERLLLATLNDPLVIADVIALLAVTARTVGDTLTIADVASLVSVYARSVPEALTVVDGFSSFVVAARSVADTVTIVDLAALGQGRTVEDTLTVADLLSSLQAAQLVFDDPLTIADGAAVFSGRPIAFDDTLTLVDSLATFAAYQRSQADPLTLADLLAATNVTQRSLADSLSIADNTAAQIVLLLTRPETLTLVDNVTRVASYARTIGDLVALADQASAAAVFFRSVADSLVAGDALSASRTVARQLADSLTLLDSIARTAAVALAQDDQLTVAEALEFVGEAYLELADLLELSDSTITRLLQAEYPDSTPGFAYGAGAGTLRGSIAGQVDGTGAAQSGSAQGARVGTIERSKAGAVRS